MIWFLRLNIVPKRWNKKGSVSESSKGGYKQLRNIYNCYIHAHKILSAFGLDKVRIYSNFEVVRVKMKKKKLLKIQTFPKVLLAQAIRATT